MASVGSTQHRLTVGTGGDGFATPSSGSVRHRYTRLRISASRETLQQMVHA